MLLSHHLLLCVCVCVLLFQKRSALAFAVFQSCGCGSRGMKVCLSPGLLFSLQKGEHVGPIATVVWIPSSSFAPYLLIAIYKDEGGVRWSFCSPSASPVFHLSSCGMAVGRARPGPPSGNTYLLSVWDAFYVNHSGNRKGIIPVKMRQIVFL